MVQHLPFLPTHLSQRGIDLYLQGLEPKDAKETSSTPDSLDSDSKDDRKSPGALSTSSVSSFDRVSGLQSLPSPPSPLRSKHQPLSDYSEHPDIFGMSMMHCRGKNALKMQNGPWYKQ